MSEQKEKFDQWNNVYAKSHKVTIEEAIADSERDQVTNRLGRERGRKYPNCKCYELMSDLKPKTLTEASYQAYKTFVYSKIIPYYMFDDLRFSNIIDN